MKSTSPCEGTPAANRATFEVIAQLFRAFADATRLQLLQCLREGPKNVSELVDELGMNQANVSKHLQTLFDANIVTREKRGTASYYSIDDEFIYPLCELVCDKLNRDQERHHAVSFSI